MKIGNRSETKTNVLQYNEYYSHGLQTANSWTRTGNGNNFLANSGTELNKTTALYDLDYRHFDPILGRMNGVDPMADKYSSLTPYNYSFNSPTMHTDASGADPDFEPNYWFEESMQRRAANKGPVNDLGDMSGNYLTRGSTLNYLRNIGGWSRSSSLSTYGGITGAEYSQMWDDAHGYNKLSPEDFGKKWGDQVDLTTGRQMFANLQAVYREALALIRYNGQWELDRPKALEMFAALNYRRNPSSNPAGYGAGPLKLPYDGQQTQGGPFDILQFSERIVDDGWGVYIRVGYKGNGSDLRWVQTVKSNFSANGEPYQFVDPYPNDDDLPFYYTNEEEQQRRGMNGYTTSFFDGPWRYSNASQTTWMAELSLVENRGGQYYPIGTISYGFQIHGGTLTLISPRYVEPSSFHLNSFTGPK